jgi:hypothetical protein
VISRLPLRPTIGTLEIAAVAFAAIAGLYGVVTIDHMTTRLGLVLLAPALEAALPLAARAVAPHKLHSARVVAALLVVFFIALAPIGIDDYLYLPAAVTLIVVIVLSNRQRWREMRSRVGARR